MVDMENARKFARCIEDAREEVGRMGAEECLAFLTYSVGGLANAMNRKPPDEIHIWTGRVIACAELCALLGRSDARRHDLD